MIDLGLRPAHRRRRPVVHPLRERQAHYGKLVQIDGSPHDWFEGRAPECTLLVYIDNATGRLMELRFVPAETTFSYFQATETYLRHYGRPLAFYSDKFSDFRINRPNAQSAQGLTQFGRACADLGIELICADSPQAKGRVEHVNGTLQDRLVKEMRLRGISSMAAGNAYAPSSLPISTGGLRGCRGIRKMPIACCDTRTTWRATSRIKRPVAYRRI